MRPMTRLQRAADLWMKGFFIAVLAFVAFAVPVAGAAVGESCGNHPAVGFIIAVLLEITFIAGMIDGRVF